MISNKNKVITLVALGVCALAGMVLVGLNTSPNDYPDSFLSLKSDESSARLHFQKFIVKHRKNYLTKEEYEARFAFFQNTLKFIESYKSTSSQVAINQFADYSQGELQQMLGTFPDDEAPKGSDNAEEA